MPFLPAKPTDVLAVHAALVPGGDAGRVLIFGGSEHHGGFSEPSNSNPSEGEAWKKTELYDVATDSLVLGTIPSPSSDVFCAGHAFLPDGRLIIGGGTSRYGGHDDNAHNHDLAWGGHRRAWIYSSAENEWSEAAEMTTEPGADSGGGRWYPTLITLADGRVMAFFGHPRHDDTRHRNTTPEWFTSSENRWRRAPAMADPNIRPERNADNVLKARLLYYPRVFVVPNGQLFFATGMPVDPIAGPIETPYVSTFYDPVAGTYVGPEIAEPPTAYSASWSFPAVLLPLLPTTDDGALNGYSTRVMFAGTGRSRWIDLGETTPAWAQTAVRSATTGSLGSNGVLDRRHGMAVLLPTGQVCLVNGVHVGGDFRDGDPPEEGVRQVELFDPGIDWTAGTYEPLNDGGSWSADPDQAAFNRNYHSVALLLPNGSVWTAGGNTHGGPGKPTDDAQPPGSGTPIGIQESEIWEPPYANDPGRPSITAAPTLLSYGQTFDFDLDDASQIERVALIRFGSVTHGTNYDQRYVGLRFTSEGNRIQATAPPSGNVAPPGNYLLWAVTSGDLPCTLAATVRLGRFDCSFVLDRATFGVFEVEALLSQDPAAVFERAVYLVMDGYSRDDIGPPPVPTLTFTDSGAAVPESQLRLEYQDTLYEDETGPTDAAQRITHVYRVRFGSSTIFDDFEELRRVQIEVANEQTRCTDLLTLVKQPNPYMIDIEGSGEDANPGWLSVDLRVFQIAEGQNRAGVDQDGDPFAFVSDLVDAFNTTGEGAGHPFRDIAEPQSQSRLELAAMVDGKRVFNYAVARVRYRAIDVNAENVRVNFRSFPVAATDLRYNPFTTYRRTAETPDGVALLGVTGGELSSIPFFAAPRVATVGPSGVSMTTQSDPLNRRTIDAGGAAEVTEYFGCWLDINQDEPRFPISLDPATDSDGPWPDAGSLSIKEHIRGLHQCLVAEIRFQEGAVDPIPPGAGPGQSDRIAQRNLAIVESDNPGGPDSRTIAHPFEIAPSRRPIIIESATAEVFTGHSPGKNSLDELLIQWGNFPRGAEAELFFGDLDVEAMLAFSASRPGLPVLRQVDNATIGIKITDTTWIPIPIRDEPNIAALLTVRLPADVAEGQHFRATVSQISGFSRRVTGTFELSVPISKAHLLRHQEHHHYSILSYIQTRVPLTNRWHPVFDRYLDVHRGRLADFGTDPELVQPDPNGLGGAVTDPAAAATLRVVIDRIELIDDRDPWIKGDGEVAFTVRAHSPAEGPDPQSTRLPATGVYNISDRPGENIIEPGAEVFRGLVSDELRLEIIGTERDTFDPDDLLGKYTRVLSGRPATIVGSYGPGDEMIEPEDMIYWRVWYRVEPV